MGCDIHLHSEIKINGVWHHYANMALGNTRSYTLFAMMAGVRNEDGEIEPVSQPRGLPGELSEPTALEYEIEKLDAHSMSWFGPDQIVKLYALWDKSRKQFHLGQMDLDTDFFGYLFGNSWASFNRFREDYPKEIEDIRWVFWFDN